ncbi:FAD-binding oxidoreductase [Nonomuraea mesophila]|uniref:FAD-binding oxidoreductase n=1 Tax=Nonomuraea mesophila TaxID=2530382 RepID=A0A4R5EA47_9ACTN|nr:FAD-dependent oxidoreductase [Nonomuraea mesophila]TDE29038.1 FAD-binding oxidoreductase [Nonomuraea mesophila]
MADRSIVVVGAGIIGASLAYHLAGHGRPVILIDAGLPGSGTTRASFAWIGRPAVSDLPSAPLRYLALDEYRRLETELPDLSIRWSGSLSWDGFDETPGPCTSDVGALEPNLLDPPAVAIHRPEDAAFDPVAVTHLLVAAARGRGARLLTGMPATALDHQAGTVSGVRTTAGVIPAETVVLAAGTGTVALCSGIGITLPVDPSPAILVRLRAALGLVRTIIAMPSLEVRQLDDGTVLAPTAYSGERDHAALLRTARRVRDRFAASFAGAGDTTTCRQPGTVRRRDALGDHPGRRWPPCRHRDPHRVTSPRARRLPARAVPMILPAMTWPYRCRTAQGHQLRPADTAC